MKVAEIKTKAKALKVKNIASMKKESLIREIQKAKGHDDCYKRIPDCGQMDCCFREDCI
jgi:hypothetical protein